MVERYRAHALQCYKTKTDKVCNTCLKLYNAQSLRECEWLDPDVLSFQTKQNLSLANSFFFHYFIARCKIQVTKLKERQTNILLFSHYMHYGNLTFLIALCVSDL